MNVFCIALITRSRKVPKRLERKIDMEKLDPNTWIYGINYYQQYAKW